MHPTGLEHASRCAGFDALDFGRLFLDQESDDRRFPDQAVKELADGG
jgi:hypothetical protein